MGCFCAGNGLMCEPHICQQGRRAKEKNRTLLARRIKFLEEKFEMKKRYDAIDINQIDFDRENPRIKNALNKYSSEITADRIHFALKSSSSNGSDQNGHGATSFRSLQNSILASKGAVEPIVVVKKDEKYICIDGNTRLAIYKDFTKNETTGDWSKIKAEIVEDWEPHDLDIIRITKHLVGSRDWPAYEKARYLYELRYKQGMGFDEIVELAGGSKNRKDIERRIDAYQDMNEYYRDRVSDEAFKIERFSGFVELQKPGIKDAIFSALFTLKDFGDWIKDGRIRKLASVRQLPQVLGDDDAKKEFIEGGVNSIEHAINTIHHKKRKGISDLKIENATIYQLAEILSQKIDKMTRDEQFRLKDTESGNSKENIQSLETLCLKLQDLISDVTE